MQCRADFRASVTPGTWPLTPEPMTVLGSSEAVMGPHPATFINKSVIIKQTGQFCFCIVGLEMGRLKGNSTAPSRSAVALVGVQTGSGQDPVNILVGVDQGYLYKSQHR